MKTITLKFGGSSLADAKQFIKVSKIIADHEGRTFVVASAPGKRFKEDTKVTDMLYACYNLAAAKQNFSEQLEAIKKRYSDIAEELEVKFDFDAEFDVIAEHLATDPQRDYMASRGEYLNSKFLAAYMGYDFIDPATCIFFNKQGQLNAEMTNSTLGAILATKQKAVVAGFYGQGADGNIRTFSRGGSDVTGAIVARAANADVYENWTDVSGMLSADPRIVKDPAPIKEISYKELRELSYMGASVLHEDAVFPVRLAGIPINIRNTNRPQDDGTWIVPSKKNDRDTVVTGISGKKGFSSILIEKAMMNNEIGFGEKLLSIIASHGMSFEHIPSGIDTMSAILDSDQFRHVKSQLIENIKTILKPDTVVVESGIALVAVVGTGMVYTKGVAAKVFSALAQADINIRMIDQGSSEINIIIGVDEDDYEKAIEVLYNAFFH